MVVIVSLLVFISVVLLVLAVGRPHGETAEGRLERYGYGPGSHRVRDLSLPFSRRVIFPVLRSLARIGAALTPGSIKEKTEEQLVLAGNPYGLRAAPFLTVAFAIGLSVPVLYGAGVTLGQGNPMRGDNYLIALCLAVLSVYVLPRMWLSLRVSARKRKIEKTLPDALDLITISVEAGLTLEAALARVVARSKGPLADEFGRALQETGLGKDRAMALRDVSKRTGVADLQSVVASLIQAEEMGTSIGNVLRVQSDAVRVRRQQRAQEQAIQAPVKMLVPLILFILPTMFVVILGPAVLRIAAIFK
ncbi:MAG: type II secretion system F family protein [Bacteroidetes bacterium]|nr:type II secretion system F family protein [Bacteroidota bacterium]MCL5026971.1 type II secretion system F family protein [Chloroflexota bacterium]